MRKVEVEEQYQSGYLTSLSYSVLLTDFMPGERASVIQAVFLFLYSPNNVTSKINRVVVPQTRTLES